MHLAIFHPFHMFDSLDYWLTLLCAAVIHAASGRSLFHAAAWPCDPVPFAVTAVCCYYFLCVDVGLRVCKLYTVP